jgi:hypothetical protein
MDMANDNDQADENVKVPLKPTPEMVAAGVNADESVTGVFDPWMRVEKVYKAMLDAALQE